MPEGQGSFIKGFGIGAAMTVGGVLLSILVGFWPLFGIGVVQALWIVPVWLSFRRRGESESAKGVLLAAGITFLLNAACWGVLMSGKIRIGG